MSTEEGTRIRPGSSSALQMDYESAKLLPSVENFYHFCGEGKLMGSGCKNCGSIICPPRRICPKCLSLVSDWIRLSGKGKIMTYTIIYSPPTQFKALAPYVVGIIQLKEGPRLPAMIRGIEHKGLKVGMDVEVDFEKPSRVEWPFWPRYFFKPASTGR